MLKAGVQPRPRTRPYSRIRGGFDANIRGLPVTQAVKVQVDAVAARDHVSTCEVLRRALDAYLTTNGGDQC
jgi:hypothetical protein